MVKLKDIFDLWYGVNLEVVNSTVVDNGIPFVSRQSVNNGVVCYVAPIEGIKPNPANTLSIAVSGSVLSTFYHDYEYYSGRDVYVAKPKEPMTKEEMLYYAYIIEQNKYRYNYGRGANRTFKDILVPTTEEIPYFIKQTNFPTIKNTSIINEKKVLNTENWRSFSIDDLFIIRRGKTLTIDDKEEYSGDIPCINGTSSNNGILCYLNDKIEEKGFRKQHVPSLSLCRVGTSGLTFVQMKPYYTADNAFCLLLKEHVNVYVYLFLSTILDKECIKYSYGRTISTKKYLQTRIKLPVTPTGEPNWQFMEDYIKSLPYSKNLEPIDPNEQIRALKKRLALTEHQLQEKEKQTVVNNIHIYESGAVHDDNSTNISLNPRN